MTRRSGPRGRPGRPRRRSPAARRRWVIGIALLALVAFTLSGLAAAGIGPFASRCGTLQDHIMAAPAPEGDRPLKASDSFDGDRGLVITGHVTGGDGSCRVLAYSRTTVQVQTPSESDDPKATQPGDNRVYVGGGTPVGAGGVFRIETGPVGNDRGTGSPQQDRVDTPVPVPGAAPVVTNVVVELVVADSDCRRDLQRRSTGSRNDGRSSFSGPYPDSCVPDVALPLQAVRAPAA